MCGIVGEIGIKKNCIDNLEEIEEMLRVQRHRGPDDVGICGFRFEGAVQISKTRAEDFGDNRKFDGILGFNRLSILDLTQKGHQPMVSENGKVILVFNGEIYNAFDYAEELKKKGYLFQSGTDTEVILKLYMEYGFEQMIRMLNGMFAIALVDLERQKLFLARDRFGIKPFYYSIYADKLVFTSEQKCFLCDSAFKNELNAESVYENYIYSGTYNLSLLKNVEQLCPGEVLTYSCGHGLEKFRFFNINDYNRPMNGIQTDHRYRIQMDRILSEAVRRQKISDVKLGCQLSGGIDSTLITTYASEPENGGLEDSVSVIFEGADREYSEESYIDTVGKKLNICEHKYALSSEYVADNLERTIWHLDTTANTPNAVGIMLLSEQAKKHVTVLLSGEGADETFGGYWQFTKAALYQRYWQIKRSRAGRLLNPFLNKYHNEQVSLMKDGYANFVANTHGVVSKENFDVAFEGQTDCSKVYLQNIENRIELFEQFSGTEFDKHIKYKMQTNLPDLLVRQDKMSMAASIENRVPFLDNQVVDYAFSLPMNQLVRWEGMKKDIPLKNGYTGKYILKSICSGFYGRAFTYRPKKGFSLPLNHFLGSPEFKGYFYEVILPGMRNRNIFNTGNIEGLYREIQNINREAAQVLWKAINLEVWCQLFVDRREIIRWRQIHEKTNRN